MIRRLCIELVHVNDPRSAVVDGLSTMVVNGTRLKVYAWCDNEWGYSSQMADLVCHEALLDGRQDHHQNGGARNS